MEECKITNLFDLEKTISKKLLEGKEYPWEVLCEIRDYILELGSTLPEDEYINHGDDVWIHKTAKIEQFATINGPCIIDKNASIRHCAYIRGNVIVGQNAVVGNSSEIKNSILFDNVEAPHFNYVGDSILGYKAHLGAGATASNLKSDKKNVVIKSGKKNIETGVRKIGAMLGDNVEVGCHAVLNPGTVVGKNTNIYPLTSVRGVIPPDSIVKDKYTTLKKLSEKQYQKSIYKQR